jgi:protein-tyrosine-phosphatase
VADPIRVLFLCVENSARSQMAEAALRKLGGDRFEVHSAGSAPAAEVRPEVLRLLTQRGYDPTGLRPKGQELFEVYRWDYVITTCDEAREACPRRRSSRLATSSTPAAGTRKRPPG